MRASTKERKYSIYGFKLVFSQSAGSFAFPFPFPFPFVSPLSSSLTAFQLSISASNSWIVGTTVGSKSSSLDVSMGTQTRPVPGCTTNGDFSRWFSFFETSISRRGYVYSRTTSCFASSRARASRLLLAPLLATASMSAHFEVLGRPGEESHFLRRLSLSVLSGRRERRCSARSLEDQGSWTSRTSLWKWGARRSRLRLCGC